MADGELWVQIKGDASSLQEAAKRGSQEMKQFAREAQAAAKIIDATKTPTEKLADKQKRLNELYEKGHLSASEYNRALKQLGREHEQLNSKSSKTFGQTALSNIGSYIASMGALSAAVGIVSKGLDQLSKDAEKGLSSLQRNQSPDKRLAQLAKSGEDLQAMRRQADDAAVKFGLGRDEARRLVFAARSEGFAGGDDFNAAARATQIFDTETVSALAGSFRGVFKGRQDLSSRQAMSGALFASQESKFDVAQLAEQARKASEMAGVQGSSAEEILAATAVLSQKFGESTGARLRAFQTQMSKSDLTRGKGIEGAMEALMGLDSADVTQSKLSELDKEKARIESMDMFSGDKRAALDDISKRREAIKGQSIAGVLAGNSEAASIATELRLLMKEFRATSRGVVKDFAATAAGGGALEARQALAEGDQSLMSQRFAAGAEAQRQIDEEQRGIRKLDFQRYQAELRTRNKGSDIGNFVAAMNEGATNNFAGQATLETAAAINERGGRAAGVMRSMPGIGAFLQSGELLQEMRTTNQILSEMSQKQENPVDGVP